MNERNQAIQLTAPGVAALAVVRVCGAKLESFFSSRFDRALVAGKAVHGNLSDDSGIIDDPVVMLSADRSWADISLHGGVWVVEAVLALLKGEGFEIVSIDDPDGLQIAFPTSDLIGREVLAALSLARTDLALTVLLNQIEAWKSLDLSDGNLIRSILEDRALEHLLNPATVALMGIPNAGKSSLANQLFGQDRSIVSEHAGTTRDWVGEEANLDGLIVRLIDTPGVRESEDPIEREAIARSARVVRAADLVIVVLDPTVDLDEQRSLMKTREESMKMREEGKQTWIEVVNKADLISDPTQFELPVSAQTGQGIVELVRRIRSHFGIEKIEERRARAWNDRTRAMLSRGT